MKTHVILVTSFLFDGLEALGLEPTWLQFAHSLINAKIEHGDQILFKTITAEGADAYVSLPGLSSFRGRIRLGISLTSHADHGLPA